MATCMASRNGHSVLPQRVALPNRRVAFESNVLLSKNKAFDNVLLSKNNALIWESNVLVSKSMRCFSVSRQRVALDFESNALFWESNPLSKALFLLAN